MSENYHVECAGVLLKYAKQPRNRLVFSDAIKGARWQQNTRRQMQTRARHNAEKCMREVDQPHRLAQVGFILVRVIEIESTEAVPPFAAYHQDVLRTRFGT
jgi:hypothetical protein